MRIFRNFVIAVSGVLAVVGAAMAQPAAPDVESATVTENRILCVHQDAPTGSRIGAKKVCHTNGEWRTIHANAEQDMLRMQDRHDNGMQGAANAAGQ